MLIAIGRQLMFAVGAMLLVATSIYLWPVDPVRPEQELAAAGARLCYAHNETLLIGAILDGEQFGDQQVQVAATVPSLQRLSLVGSRVTNRGIQTLQSLPGLWNLNLGRTGLTPDVLKTVADFPSLSELRLDGCGWLQDEHLPQLAPMKNLESLSLAETSITPAALKHLRQLPRLRFLILDQCPNFTDASIESLIEFCRQRRFNVSLSGTDITAPGLARLRQALPECLVQLRPESMVGLRAIADRGQFITDPQGEIWAFRARTDFDGLICPLQPGDLSLVRTIVNLTELNLDQTNIDNAMLGELGSLPSLELLRLCMTRITDDGLAALAGFPKLNSLWLMENDIDGRGLSNLRHAPLLTELKIQTRRGDEILSHLQSLERLETLTVCAPLTNDGMKSLARLPRLKHLVLIETQVRGPGIMALNDSPSLTELRLDGGLIDDSDIDSIARLKSLTWLVFDQSRVTSSGRDRILALRPDVSLHWSGAASGPVAAREGQR